MARPELQQVTFEIDGREVQENIIGNCLCVLGDSMAMPILSMVKHFREEFVEHMESARERADREALVL